MALRRSRRQPVGVLAMAVGAALIAYALLGGDGTPGQRRPLERADTAPTVLGVTVAPGSTHPLADPASPATFERGGSDGQTPTPGATPGSRGAGTSTTDSDTSTSSSTTTAGSSSTTTTGSTTTSTEPTTTTTEPTTTTTTPPTTEPTV